MLHFLQFTKHGVFFFWANKHSLTETSSLWMQRRGVSSGEERTEDKVMSPSPQLTSAAPTVTAAQRLDPITCSILSLWGLSRRTPLAQVFLLCSSHCYIMQQDIFAKLSIYFKWLLTPTRPSGALMYSQQKWENSPVLFSHSSGHIYQHRRFKEVFFLGVLGVGWSELRDFLLGSTITFISIYYLFVFCCGTDWWGS